MSTRDAIAARIRFLREREEQQKASVNRTKSEIADLIAQRDALTDAEDAKVTDLARVGIVKVSD